MNPILEQLKAKVEAMPRRPWLYSKQYQLQFIVSQDNQIVFWVTDDTKDMLTSIMDAVNFATPAMLDAIGKMVEALEECAALPFARVYPDGPCLEHSLHKEVKAALAAFNQQLGTP